MTWGMFPAPMHPWDDDVEWDDESVGWPEDRLNEQEFWIVLAQRFGNHAAQQAWDRLDEFNDLSAAFPMPEFHDGDLVALWICATNADEEFRLVCNEGWLIRKVSLAYDQLAFRYDEIAALVRPAGRVGKLDDLRGVANEVCRLTTEVDDIALSVRHAWKMRVGRKLGVPIDGWHDEFCSSLLPLGPHPL